MNVVILNGRLTADPKTRTANGKDGTIKFTEFTVACDRRGEGADFIRVSTSGKLAEACEKYLAKGKMVGVHGAIRTGNYKDKDGKTVYTTDVFADTVEFLSK